MKKLHCLTFAATLLLSLHLSAQDKTTTAKPFQGAISVNKQYRVVYQLNSEDDKKITATFKNINNALEDPRLAGKLKVELVVHGEGVAAFKKESPYEQQLLALQKQGVILAQCEKTLKTRNIKKEELFGFIAYVPSANGELIILQDQGWSIIHP
jgi:intracellular sulfur oxidation DsrE/DsrF family protein